jgi:cytochrome P450
LCCRPARFIENDPEYAEEHAAYKPRHPYAYIPFGAGAHKCIGYRFAQEEALLSLVLFFQRFEVRLDKEHHKGELTLQNAITLTPKGGIWVKIYKRKE